MPFKFVEKTIEVADTCDICHKTIETMIPDKYDHILKIEFGYGSGYDMERFDLILCDTCFNGHVIDLFLNYGRINGE